MRFFFRRSLGVTNDYQFKIVPPLSYQFYHIISTSRDDAQCHFN